MDMGRTAVNVMGNCIATAVVARWEGVFDDAKMQRVRGGRSGVRRAMRVLVTGAVGQLGVGDGPRVLAAATTSCRSPIDDLDLTAHARRDGGGRHARAPDAIVNCAAYTDVDGAEDHPVEALEVNAFAVRSLAAAAREAGATLVHYSTDFVFDGTGDRPVHRGGPAGARGASTPSRSCSASGSRATRGRHYVLRVESLFGGCRGRMRRARRSSVDRIVDAIRRRARGAGVRRSDRDAQLHRRTWRRRRGSCSSPGAPSGLYHCVNSGVCTWFELGGGDRPAARRGRRACWPCRSPRSRCARPARSTARCRTRSSRRRASPCRRGRTRWRATW